VARLGQAWDKPEGRHRRGSLEVCMKALNKLVTSIQNRLEVPAGQGEDQAAYALLALAAGYLLVRLGACLI